MYAKYKQLQKRRGGKKAHIAIARKVLVAIYHMLSKDEPYNAELYRHVETAPKNRAFTSEQALAFLRRKGYTILDNEAV